MEGVEGHERAMAEFDTSDHTRQDIDMADMIILHWILRMKTASA